MTGVRGGEKGKITLSSARKHPPLHPRSPDMSQLESPSIRPSGGRKRKRQVPQTFSEPGEMDGKSREGREEDDHLPHPDDDDGEVDMWKVVPVSKDDPLPPPLEESSFATLFPKYREKYLREMWPFITKTLKHYGIACELNLLEGSMTVKTTRKTWDPYAIIKARDLLKLLARSIPAQQAVRIMEDGMHCDIIKIKNMVRNRERFIRRRNRLIGPNGCTLKAIELVTDCYVMVQGNTVAVMGSNLQGLKEARRIVIGCMNNQHPIYSIKVAMIKKELAQDPTLKNEDWSRFLPSFKRTKPKNKPKKPEIRKKKKNPYSPFPPPQKPRKIDLQLESGEYFLSQAAKQKQERERRKKAGEEKRARKKQKLAEQFIPPKED